MTMHPFQTGDLKIESNPVHSIQNWLAEARSAGLPEPTSMSLATLSPSGLPSVRIVLCKGFSDSKQERRLGIEFYTNYESRKGQELLNNPNCALCFHWVAMRRQVRIEGRVEKLTYAESDAYFQTRPRESRIGAWSSPQSKVIQSRKDLESFLQKTQERFGAEGPVPCPENWGGFRVVPTAIEFWEERPHRLHERRRFEWNAGTQAWTLKQLAP